MKCGGSVIAPDSFTTIKHKMEMTLHLNDMDAHPRHNKGTRFFNFSMRVSERKRRMAEKCTCTAERDIGDSLRPCPDVMMMIRKIPNQQNQHAKFRQMI